MRATSSVVKSLIKANNVEHFFLVNIGDSDYSTSLPYDVTMSNGITYLAENGLVAVDPPRLSQTVDRESYKIQFADPNYLMRSYFEAGATGDKVEVYIGFINNTSASINGTDGVAVLPMAPFKNTADCLLVYRGTVDNHGYEINLGDNTVIATIEGSSPMSDLDLVRALYTSKDSIRQFDSTDTAYDQIYEGSGEMVTKWGKV